MSKTFSSDEASLSRDPIQQFRRWFEQARRDSRLKMPEAMCLSTIDIHGFPAARMVLLKGYDRRGFVFYTNVHSPKAADLLSRAKAALTFYWPSVRRQIRIQGRVTRVPKRLANAYFVTRGRLSQIGSWASLQSQPLASRSALLDQFQVLEAKFQGRKVPAPPHWHGFRVVPQRMEFWQERPNRLHDRWLYVRNRGGWKMTRLYP